MFFLRSIANGITQPPLPLTAEETVLMDTTWRKEREKEMDPLEFAEDLKRDPRYRHHFPPTTPSSDRRDGPRANPFAKESFNLTEQGRLFKTNPELAVKLAREAGVTL